MLGPVVQDRRLVGWLSVHENESVRSWSEGDVEALEVAMAQVRSILSE
jgi:signal transduction protein with GAF and PtsI domain